MSELPPLPIDQSEVHRGFNLYTAGQMRSYAESARAALLAELAGKMPKPYPVDEEPAGTTKLAHVNYNRALADVRAALGLPEVP